MQLFLDSYGAFLAVRNGQFFVRAKANGSEHLFAVRQIDAIFLTKGTAATTDAYLLALENDIPILFLDGIGHPVGQIWSGKFGSISTIRRHQIQFATHTEGWLWMAKMLREKIDNQRLTLIEAKPHFENDENAIRRFNRAIPTLQHLANQFERWQPATEHNNFERIANTFRAWEATASRHYFRFLASIAPPQYQFNNRNFRPARDPFNALLNYLYGILYAQVELALMKTGVDPYLGILHIDRHNRPTMVYDFIEAYRHWADRTALNLVFSNHLPENAFDIKIEADESQNTALESSADPQNSALKTQNWQNTEGGVFEKAEAENENEIPESNTVFTLATAGKSIVVSTFLQYLDERILYKKQQHKRLVVLDLEAQTLAATLKKGSWLDG
jgi:CRISP-associated protein Cas1